MQTAAKLLVQTTDSEFIALLVEAELISLHQPPFNSALKDDKSRQYLYLTTERFPQLKPIRGKELSQRSIQKKHVFGPFSSGFRAKHIISSLRKAFPFCSATATDKKNGKACFFYHLGQCPGACVGTIPASEYQKTITNLRLFLRGKNRLVIKRLQQKMDQASAQQNFEQAAQYRDQLHILSRLSRQRPSGPDLQLPTLSSDIADEKLLRLRQLLRQHTALPATYPLNRIEAYDISNTNGTNPTGSMVVFTQGTPDPAQYRRFKIKTLNTPNDVGMLKEVLTRRQRHSDWPTPNLIIIDGGKNQLKAAISVIKWSIPITSIAKHPDRFLIPTVTLGEIHTIQLKPTNPATHLIQHIRDESHRFAKNYHKHLRQKASIS